MNMQLQHTVITAFDPNIYRRMNKILLRTQAVCVCADSCVWICSDLLRMPHRCAFLNWLLEYSKHIATSGFDSVIP